METAYEQAVRQRYRALALIIKAKLEAIEAGVATVEQELLAYFVLPDGGTVGDAFTAEVVDQMQANGELPPLLPEPRRKAILLPETT